MYHVILYAPNYVYNRTLQETKDFYYIFSSLSTTRKPHEKSTAAGRKSRHPPPFARGVDNILALPTNNKHLDLHNIYCRNRMVSGRSLLLAIYIAGERLRGGGKEKKTRQTE